MRSIRRHVTGAVPHHDASGVRSGGTWSWPAARPPPELATSKPSASPAATWPMQVCLLPPRGRTHQDVEVAIVFIAGRGLARGRRRTPGGREREPGLVRTTEPRPSQPARCSDGQCIRSLRGCPTPLTRRYRPRAGSGWPGGRRGWIRRGLRRIPFTSVVGEPIRNARTSSSTGSGTVSTTCTPGLTRRGRR